MGQVLVDRLGKLIQKSLMAASGNWRKARNSARAASQRSKSPKLAAGLSADRAAQCWGQSARAE